MFIYCISDYSQLSTEQNETTVEFLLRNTDNVQNDCTLQMCITRSDYFGCIHNIQCTVTLPASNNTLPLLLQWIPIGNLTGTLAVSNYEKVYHTIVGDYIL